MIRGRPEHHRRVWLGPIREPLCAYASYTTSES